ncbi:MAG TPA: hypothetical protein VGN26_12375 [Armatimonadota bacterium]|jgi:hypothetical protein
MADGSNGSGTLVNGEARTAAARAQGDANMAIALVERMEPTLQRIEDKVDAVEGRVSGLDTRLTSHMSAITERVNALQAGRDSGTQWLRVVAASALGLMAGVAALLIQGWHIQPGR